MFSVKQKQQLAAGIEKLILDIGHPEMPTEKLNFHLSVIGKEPWSWAEIKPNWMFDENNKPGINPHNEAMEKHSKERIP